MQKTPATTESGHSMVTTIVAGIVRYTRWPPETRPIRLCTLGKGRGVDELLGAADLGSTQMSVSVRAVNDATSAANECDAVYVGNFAAQTARGVLQRTLGRPVLMIGEGQAFCTDGGMFCLLPGEPAMGFVVNLDAVARSGLRVNPQVLRIARGTTVSGP